MACITNEPLILRDFLQPIANVLKDLQLDEREYVARCVLHINAKIEGSYVFFSGKNMGVSKAVSFPEDVARYYRPEEYTGYCWTAA